MKTVDFKWMLIVLLSVFVLSCKKDSEIASPSPNPVLQLGEGTTSTLTARYTKNVTLEDYTGLNCGFCPRARTYLQKAETAYGAKVIGIEVHGTGYEDHGSPFTYSQADDLGTSLGATAAGYPAVRIDRTITANNGGDPVPEIKPYITSSSSSAVSSTVGLGIASNLSGSVLSITVKSRFSNATSGSKLVVYVLEDGVAGNQHSYFNTDPASPYYNQGDILTYKHDGVLRTSATAVLGDAIVDQATAAEYTKTYSVTVPANWNSSNLSIVAMVVQANNKLLNAQQAKVGEIKQFDILVP